MEEVNVLVIGAGVVGLSIAKVLSEEFEDVVVVEKEKSFGRHTSSRNSEVIHSGIYYSKDSLKAKFCVEGNKLLYDFCEKHNVPYQNCGKLVVATSEEELDALYKLKEKGERNGVQNLKIIDKEECLQLEPQVKAIKALKVDATGIVDTHSLMHQLALQAEKNDAFIIYDMEVTAIKKVANGYQVSFADGEIFQANYVINSAGLFSDKIAEMAGLDISNLKIHWCKGEYYKTTKIKNIKHLIYPLPDPKGISLGIHLTINLNGEVRFGPNAYYVDELNYAMDETYLDDFYQAVNRYIEVKKEHLQLDDCGIRPKLQGPNDDYRDYYIQEESANGLPNFINLIGIESPGLTSCLAIAEYVKEIMKK
ncbi:MAG: NAD(P)/FAD-dependent oxidoreductase [Candidatus Cloacimonadota bacterium]|nr:MAG: NAD(P)/FAD-dependent oxidoreductase [Candidatus Cloacimonadota bacterium]